MIRPLLLVALITLAGCTGPGGGGEGTASVEFSFRPDAPAGARRHVALQLWRTGVVKRVDSAAHLKRVYLHAPENLLHVDQVQRLLEQHSAVETVHSLLSYMRGRGG